MVTGLGNFGGELRLDFVIFEREELTGAVIDPIEDQVYTGSELTPKVTVRLGETVLRLGLDYGLSYANNVNAGTATVTVTGNGAYQGTATANFTIVGKPIGDYNIRLSKTEYTYNGSPFEPTVDVYDENGWYLYKNRDYTVSYENNTYPGTATVTVTGMGNYAGTKTAEFTIHKLDLNDIYSCSVDTVVYTAKPQTPFIRLSLDGWTYLVEGTDYEILGWANNVAAGTGTVTVRGLGSFTGERTIEFTINPMPMYQNDYTVNYDTYMTYTGEPLNPVRSVVWKLTGETLVEGRDYTIVYYNWNYELPDNENNDNHTDICNNIEVQLRFTGNFSGNTGSQFYFNIVEAPDTSVLPLEGSYSGMVWRIDMEGTLWVAGMADLSYHNDVAFRPYRQYVKKIVLSDAHSITAGFFQECPYVTEAVLPDGLTSISYSVFSGCDSLTKINIPDSVTMVAGSAFPRVQGLEIHLPDNITDFDGNYAFDNISGSTKVFVRRGSASAQKLIDTNGYFFYEGYPDFQLMKSLNTPALGLQLYRYFGSGGTVTIPDFVDSIPNGYGFSDTYLIEKVIIPANVGNLGWGGGTPFQNSCGLREIVIEPGDKLTELPSHFISGCDNITLYLPDNITSIGTLNYYSSSNMLIVANCNSYAIEWAKSQTSWGSRVWYDESEMQTGPRYRMIHDLVHHEGHAATCTEPGCTDWDTCTRCDYTSYTELPALGHAWGEPSYVWADDYSEVTASCVCANDESHTLSETVKTTATVTKAATCTEPGETTYTAVFENELFTKQTKTVANVPATGHDWGKPSYEWAEDNASVTATRVCRTDADHVETETVNTTSEVTKKATCTEPGETTYTAVFENPAFSAQTKTVANIPATGHSYGEPVWAWAEDFSAATATFTCAEGDDTQVLDATVTVERTEPTTEEEGLAVYTATVEFEGKTYTDVQNVVLPMLPPVTVPDAAVVAMSTAGIALGWSAVVGAEKYELQRMESGGSWATLAELSETAYLDGTAKMGVNYSYRVRAFIGGAWGEFGAEAEVFFNPFEDVSGKKTIEYVAWAYNNAIVNGTSVTTFAPNDPCTRIQFIMMLWKAHGSPIVGGTNPFKDISGKKTTNAILWALDAGVINSGRTFDPNGNISRVQIVMILWKLAGSPEVEGENPFVDVSGKKTTKAVLWAYSLGITKGTDKTHFAPDDDCTRVQLVVFLYKYNGIYHII